MKKFSLQILVFLVPILIVSVAFEAVLRHIPNDYKYKNMQLQQEKQSVKTLILGSSHSLYGFNPKYFSDKAYNLGHVSQTIDLDYLLLEKYIEELTELKTVVVRLSYTTLHEQIKTGSESWRLKDYNLYYDLNSSNKLKYKSEVLSVKLKNNISNIKKYYFNNDTMISVDQSGWAAFEEPFAKKQVSILGPIAAKRHKAKDDDLVDKNLDYLSRIIKRCKEKDVNVILVTLPAHKTYVKYLDRGQLEMVISAGHTLANEYNNCNYINLLEDDNYNDLDFYDADHLNENGAKKVSLYINEMISNL